MLKSYSELDTMKHKNPFNPPQYDPNRLLNTIIRRFGLRNDSDLARFLEAQPSHISKLRNHRLRVSPELMIRIHELTGIGIREMRSLMGDNRRYCSLSRRNAYISGKLGQDHVDDVHLSGSMTGR